MGASVVDILSASSTPALPSSLDTKTHDNFTSFRVLARRRISQQRHRACAASSGKILPVLGEDDKVAALPLREVDSGYGAASDKLSDG